jgi:hypothetical protein
VGGIVGLLMGWCCAPIGIVGSIMGVVCGIIVINKADTDPVAANSKGMAIAGLVLGAIALLMGIGFMIFMGLGTAMNMFKP